MARRMSTCSNSGASAARAAARRLASGSGRTMNHCPAKGDVESSPGRGMHERSKALTALIVDDHPLMRSALREALAPQCAEIVEAENPEEGLERLAARPDVDVIVLDLNFSTHEGLAFIPRYRQAAPAAPLVIYTIHEDAHTLN